MRTAREGSIGFKDTAGVWSKHILVAAPFIVCITMSEILTILPELAALLSCIS